MNNPFFPETKEEFLFRMRDRVRSQLNSMVEQGLFAGVHEDENGIRPIPFFQKFSISKNPTWTMANIVVELKLFPSITQARKNGWDKPLTKGVHCLTKKKIMFEIID